jgi:small-conductance mechanosensitive channel
MAAPAQSHPLRVLVRNLALAVLLAVALYVIFTLFDHNLRHNAIYGLSAEEILLLEALAVVAVAYAVSRAFTRAADEVLRRRGQVHHGALVRIFLSLIIAVAAMLALFDLAGVSAQSLFLGSAFVGIILGLAAQTVLSNVFAGILIVMASPFRPGDRVGFMSSTYGALAPSYPHELIYPNYSGTVEDVELLYTILRLDAGGVGKIPNSVVLSALIHQPKVGAPKAHRVRMTFPYSVPVAAVESALPEVVAAFPEDAARTPPRLEVSDLSVGSWDGVIVLWSPTLNDNMVRDRVMRAVLARHPLAVAPPPAK